MDNDEIIFHLAEDRARYFEAVTPPIIQSSNFVFESIADLRQKVVAESENYVYSRGINPTVDILRKKIAALENAEDALVVGSGVAAISCAVMANLKTGDHVLCVDKPYSWTKKLFDQYLPKFGISVDYFVWENQESFQSQIKANTRVVFLESPNSLTFELQDLGAIAEICKSKGIISIIDNSHTSPLYQKPINFGIDIVVHSATKYLNGHSDVMMGVICSSQEMIKKIFYGEYMTLGPIVSAHDAFLAIRGLRTLPIRLEQSDKTCLQLFHYFKNHPKVRKVYYPFDPDAAQYDLAKKQMSGNGGLISIELAVETKEEVNAFVEKISKFMMAASWGGYESLFLPTLAFYDIPGWKNPVLPFQLIRFYVGLEEFDYLVADLDAAFEAIG